MSDTHDTRKRPYNQFNQPAGACLELNWVRAANTFMEHRIMTQDAEFEKKDFDRIITRLLRSQPLRKNGIHASKQAKLGSVIPRPARQSKSAKADGA